MTLKIETHIIAQDDRRALERVASNRWPDCADLMHEIAYESQRVRSWRPARAGALVALQKSRVWMTLDEFENFLANTRLPKLRGKVLSERLEIGKKRLKAIREGSPISRVEALACAHYQLGLALPVPAGDVEAFGPWVNARFGAFEAIGNFLGIRGDDITNRIRGYDTRKGGRVPCKPGPQLIRALDWVYRVGPSCPFGDAPDVEYWPGHEYQP